MELNLNNPIFTIYLNLNGFSREFAEKKIHKIKETFSIYTNITIWVMESDETKIECVYDGKSNNKKIIELTEDLKERFDILSNSKTLSEFNSNIREWKLKNLID